VLSSCLVDDSVRGTFSSEDPGSSQDSTPDSFSFVSLFSVSQDSLEISDIPQITGINVPVSIGIGSSGVAPFDLIEFDDFVGKSFNFRALGQGSIEADFNPDGTKLFVMDDLRDKVREFDLSIAYDITTLSDSGKTLDILAQDDWSREIDFNNDGTKMFMVGSISDKVHEYNLTTGFDIGTASFTGTFTLKDMPV